jgi:hypothetical protein
VSFATVRIDVLTAISGVPTFAGAWRRRAKGIFGAVPTQYLSLADLMKAKEAAGRLQDLADLEMLMRAACRRQSRRRP